MNKEKKAIVFANIAAIILVIIKLTAWILTWSMAVLSSALDSMLDFLVSSVNIYILKKSWQKECENYNYWHGKIEWFWAIFEWLIVFISGLSIIFLAINKIINKWWVEKIDLSIIIMIISICITWALVIYLNKVAKETNSLVVKSDCLHYKSDLVSNLWIIISLIIVYFTKLDIIDAIISIMVASYIILWAKNIILEWYHMLMDRSIEKEEIEKIISLIKNSWKLVDSFHFLKTRKSWKDVFVDFHLVFVSWVSLKDAHDVADDLELKILKEIPNSTVMIHLDPYDDSLVEERRKAV